MNIDIESKIQAIIPEMQGKHHLLHMSCGADSLAAWLRMRDWGLDITPVYMYYMEGLPIIDNYLDYLENFFDTKIYRLPSPLLWTDIDNGVFQPPRVGQKLNTYINSLHWPKYTTDFYNNTLFGLLPDLIHATGVRVTDGINRASSIKKYGVYKDKKWLPIASFGFNDIKDILTKHALKLSPDYALFGMSFESPRYWTSKIMSETCPETWKKLLTKFPLLKLQLGQADAIGKGTPNGAKRRIKIYEDHVIDYKGWKI